MAKLDLQITPFQQSEIDAFNKAWISMISIFNRDRGMVMVFTTADAELVMLYGQHMKNRFQGETFVGSNTEPNGFSIRWALPEDLLQDDANAAAAPFTRVLDWRQHENLTTGEWETGRRNWISSRPANTGTFDDAADARVELRDANNAQKWGMVMLAIQESNPDPVLKNVLRDFGAKDSHAVVNVRWHMISSEFQIHKLDEPLLVDDVDPFRIGLEIIGRPSGGVGATAIDFGNTFDLNESFIIPLAAVYINQRRAIANNTAGAFPRPTATA